MILKIKELLFLLSISAESTAKMRISIKTFGAGADIILKVETPNTIKKKVKAKIQGKETTPLPLPDGQRRTFVDRQLEDGVLGLTTAFTGVHSPSCVETLW